MEGSYLPCVFTARWPADRFASHGEFLRLTQIYDSAMQGFIQGMPPQELLDYFVPYDDVDLTSPAAAVEPVRNEDAISWLARNMPGIDIPWLAPDDHTEVLSEDEDKFGMLNAFGAAGYLTLFVADEL